MAPHLRLPGVSDFQGFPNIQHLREILKSQKVTKKLEKNNWNTLKNPHVCWFVCSVVYFCRYILFFWVGWAKQKSLAKTEGKIVDRSSRGWDFTYKRIWLLELLMNMVTSRSIETDASNALILTQTTTKHTWFIQAIPRPLSQYNGQCKGSSFKGRYNHITPRKCQIQLKLW